MSPRQTSLAGELARVGFSRVEAAADLLRSSGLAEVVAPAEFAEAPDPDRALAVLTDVLAADPAALAPLSDPRVRLRALRVFGLSEELGAFVVRHPEHMAAVGLDAIGEAGQRLAEVGRGEDGAVQLRVEYRRHLLGVASRDLAGEALLEQTMADLSDLADGALQGCLEVARAELGTKADAVRLAVIAMGKTGARELNYISDVDVVFVAEPSDGADTDTALRVGQQLARRLIVVANQATPEGSIWEVDAALRPEGKSGPLVRTLDSHVAYYTKWAKTWEYQALLKARPAAGDAALGAAYIDAVSDFVWSAADRENFVEDVQAMRRRVEAHIPAKEADREIKLGRGGLRDVEFAVQLLQLVHGRSDVTLRSSNTLAALEALATWGYVGRDDASSLSSAYRLLRTLEHRVQLRRLRRTHLMPERESELRVIARSMGMRRDPATEIQTAFAAEVRQVRQLHQKLFYRPLLNAVARLDSGEARLTLAQAGERLRALGYQDPQSALRHLEALISGVSRRAAIQRTLLPVMLGWFADCPDPDAGLLGFRRVSETLGSTPWYLRLLRDQSLSAERMAGVLASSRYATDLLLRAPEGVAILADQSQLVPRPAAELLAETLAAASRQDDAEAAITAVRATRRRELFRTSAAAVLGRVPVEQIGPALSDIADATIAAALQTAIDHVGDVPTRMAVIGMGRYGGRELGFSSDADVMFVHDPMPGVAEAEATRAALAVANTMRTLLSQPNPDPPLGIDADLRPEGRNGPLVRTLASYAAYYARWSSAWEAQALLRARPLTGDPVLQAAFLDLIEPLRFPAGGVGEKDLREMRRLKARMESERLPRGADPALHLKLGRGGLSDVEWVAQLLQMQHGAQVSDLRTTQTLRALQAAAVEGLLAEQDADRLMSAWLLASSIRDAIMLSAGKASDLVPTEFRTLARVAHLLGYPPDDRGAVLEDYRRAARRARAVMERVFFGLQ